MTNTPLPPLPTEPLAAPLRVVVLTCGDLGLESAAALAHVPNVELVAVVRAPMPRAGSFKKRLKLTYRRRGIGGVLAIPFRKVRALLQRSSAAPASSATLPTDLRIVDVARFETEEGLAALRALAPDLAIVDGTYILKEPVFMLPRFGAVNLHCGRLPDYKGAPPGFWELYNDEREVGVTVHRVTARLDAGPILGSSTVSLDRAPADDPMAYVDRLWREGLRPQGIRLLCDAATAIATGSAHERPQGTTTHPTYKFPDWATVKALRARVRQRRAEA